MPVNTRYFLPQTKDVGIRAPFNANGKSQIKLELPGYYTELILRVTMAVTPASSVSAATDWESMVIKGLKIKADNSRPFLDLDDGRQLKYYDYFMSGGSLFIPDLPAGGGEKTTLEYQLPIHLGDYYKNRYDVPPDKEVPPSEVICTRDLSNLMFEIAWGSNTDLGTGFTIDADNSYAELTVSYLLLQPGISEAVAFAGRRGGVPGFFQPGTQIQKERNIRTTYSNLGYSCDFLNDFYIKDCLIFATRDDDGKGVLVLKDNLLTKLQLIRKDGRDLYTVGWDELRRKNAVEFGLPSLVSGVTYLNLREILGVGFEGVYVKNAGDLKWKFTIDNVDGSNPGYIIILYRTHDVARARADVRGARPAILGV